VTGDRVAALGFLAALEASLPVAQRCPDCRHAWRLHRGECGRVTALNPVLLCGCPTREPVGVKGNP